jgi:hypothetical protein
MLHVNQLIGFGAGGDGPSPITFVGAIGDSQTAEVGNTPLTASVSLTSLTGGIDTAARSGDIVLVIMRTNNETDSNMSLATSGYTEVADLYANDDLDINFGAYYKVMGGTPDTSVTTTTYSSASLRNVDMLAYVLRYVDTVTPLDATTTTATFVNTAIPNPPAITTVTAGAVVVALGGSSSKTLSSPPTGYSNHAYEGVLAAALKKIESPQSENPGAFPIGGSDFSISSAAAATMALRPAFPGL